MFVLTLSEALQALSAHRQRLPTAGTQPERDLQHYCSFRERNNSDAEDMMPCTPSGGPELYVRVVCSAN